MILGIAEDFTSNVVLDNDLKSTPKSGLYLNSGIHPSITLDNLLQFLPSLDVIIASWDLSINYNVFSDSRNISDIVSYNSKIYQSIKVGINHLPTDTIYWVETNLDSLRLKTFIYKVLDKVYSDLRLTRRLVDNQYLYEVGKSTITLPNDYASWTFETKGSDYTSFRINEISFQKKSTTPINLYIINQGVLIDTKTVTPTNGTVSFSRLDYEFSGKGKWRFVIDSTDVETNNYSIDPLSFYGFVAYTETGTGLTPESATYTAKTTGNGLGFNISVYLDSTNYILNNMSEFGNYIRATFEYMVFQMFLYNPNKQLNPSHRIMNENLLTEEVLGLKTNTVASRYFKEKEIAIKQLKKTFDRNIGFDNFTVKIGTF